MKYEWLENAVFYEIYPTSFYDSDGDGIGDIRGIIQKLSYVRDLGANAIWLNPCFVSPFKDGGYDVADYCRVDSRFGTNDDLKEMFAVAADMGIKILLDLVPGHTSVEHPWFVASQKAGENEFTHDFIWKPGSEPMMNGDGKFISGISERPDMFMINFFAMQPALNYGFYRPKKPWQDAMDAPAPLKNRARLVDICKFWLSMGAAGFRVDMAGSLVKGDTLLAKGSVELWNDVIGRVKADFPRAVFVSEWFNPRQSVKKSAFDIDFGSAYFLYGTWGAGVDEKYFKNCWLGEYGTHYVEARAQYDYFRRRVRKKGYQAVTLGNHDRTRMSLGRSEVMQKLVFAFHLTIPHVPFIYYGDEIGMRYLPLTSKDGGYYRTGSRTPMQWSEGKGRGFSQAEELYLPVDDVAGLSVEAQRGNENSLLETVRALVKLKREGACFAVGAKYKVLRNGASPFVFKRESDADEACVIIAPKKGARKRGRIPHGEWDETISENVTLRDGTFETTGEGFAVLYRKKR